MLLLCLVRLACGRTSLVKAPHRFPNLNKRFRAVLLQIPDSCTVIPGGGGIVGADYVVFVTAVQTSQYASQPCREFAMCLPYIEIVLYAMFACVSVL